MKVFSKRISRREWVMTTVLWAVSAIVTAFGLWRDASGGWGSWGFATNLASSVASATFGIPIAVILIQRFTDRGVQEEEKRQVHEQAARAARELLSATQQLIGSSGSSGIPATPVKLYLTLFKLSVDLSDVTNPVTLKDHLPQMRTLLSEVETQFRMDRTDHGTARDTLASQAQTKINETWRDVNGHVRVRLKEQGLPWVDGGHVSALDQAIARLSRRPGLATAYRDAERNVRMIEEGVLIPPKEVHDAFRGLWTYVDAAVSAHAAAVAVFETLAAPPDVT